MSTIQKKFDVISVIGRTYKNIASECCQTKLSAFFVNDLIARQIGFKGHSDYLASAVNEPQAHVDKILKKSNIDEISNAIYDLVDQDAYIRNLSEFNSTEKEFESTINYQDEPSSEQDSTLRHELKKIASLISSLASTKKITASRAKKEFLKLCASRIEDIYEQWPVLFTASQFIDAYKKVQDEEFDDDNDDGLVDLLNELFIGKKAKEFHSIREIINWIAPEGAEQVRSELSKYTEIELAEKTMNMLLTQMIQMYAQEIYFELIKIPKVVHLSGHQK